MEVYMGLLKNISSMIRSNLNDLLNRAEDPEKMLSSLILDMKQSFLEAKNEVKNAIMELKRIEKETEENRSAASQWEEKALLALDAGREDLAKESLRRKRNFEKLSRSLESEASRQEKVVGDLREQLLALKAKLDEAKAKKMVITTARRIRKVNADSSSGSTEKGARLSVDLSPFEMYDKMEEKIRALEDEVEALRDIDSDEIEDDVDRELEKIAADDIEEELRDLRLKATGKPSDKKAAGKSGVPSGSDKDGSGSDSSSDKGGASGRKAPPSVKGTDSGAGSRPKAKRSTVKKPSGSGTVKKKKD
jgi:phage shock protein A